VVTDYGSPTEGTTIPKRIGKDHGEFRDIVGGKIRKGLKDRVKSGSIFKSRGRNGKISITIPRLDLPQFLYGKAKQGVGRGEGKIGDVIGKDDPGKGKGNKAGQGSAEGIEVAVDMEDVVKMLKDELELPNLLPKPSETFEEVKKRYNSLARTGPNALMHRRKTLRNTLKRQMAQGGLERRMLPGFTEPMAMLKPINDDLRYRQYTEHRIPSSNAIIFFARDWSASMDNQKCEIVSDMAWWIDLYIRHYYKRVEKVYIGHDTIAEEVGEDKFYKYRYGGGTTCSSAPKLIASLLEHRYPPQKYNIYVFYFSDGENWQGDNEVFSRCLQEELGPNQVNFIGLTQVMCWGYDWSVNKHIEEQIEAKKIDPQFVRTAYVGGTRPGEKQAQGDGMFNWGYQMADEERDQQIKEAIKALLGKGNRVAAA
jgi:uncharacterized sporulation protein YeaH/YhbH (DUF444 family)